MKTNLAKYNVIRVLKVVTLCTQVELQVTSEISTQVQLEVAISK